MERGGYSHSPKVPKIYKVASKIAQRVVENGDCLKDLVYNEKKFRHTNKKGLYALVVTTIDHEDILGTLILESKILRKEAGLDPWLARILMTELLWGKKKLPPPDSKPVETVQRYHDVFLKTLREAVKSGSHENKPRPDADKCKPRYIRVNTLKLSVERAIAVFCEEGWRRTLPAGDDYTSFLARLATLREGEFVQDFHVDQVLAFPPRTEFYAHPLYLDYSIILQDKATCLAPLLLNPTPGSVVLDMCAAPGLKTTQLAAIMNNTGTLYAVDRHLKRFQTLCDFVSSHGATNVTTLHADATSLEPAQFQEVEFILVDPSCSGSGMARPGKCSDPDNLAGLAAFHVVLLERALTRFPAARRVVYSTCSLNERENEAVLRDALDAVNRDPERPLFRVADDPLPSWLNRGSGDFPFGHGCLYSRPQSDLATGFFVAVLERTGKRKRKRECVPIEVEGKVQKDSEREVKKCERIDDALEIAPVKVNVKKKKKKKVKKSNRTDDALDIATATNSYSMKKKKKREHPSSTT